MKLSLKLRSSLLLAATMWLLTLPAESQAETSTGIIINEIMVSNVGDVISPAFNFDGWVELYNPTSKAISLEGYTVSGGASASWRLPASIGSIPAKGFKVIAFGSNEIRSDQAPFKLDCDGGTISLSDKSGKTVTTLTYPAGMSHTAWARTEDGGGNWSWTSTPTPGASNATAIFANERLEAPVVNIGSKLFTGTLRVSVEIPEGATLMYTTDGSVPRSTEPKETTQTETEAKWTEMLVNGDCEGGDATCFVSYNGDEATDVNRIEKGVGYNGSRGIKVHSIDNPKNAWDTQFFIYTPDHVWKAGEKYRFSMKVRADKPARVSVQTHTSPHNYIYWSFLNGDIYFTEEWEEFNYEGVVSADQTGDGMQTIAFNLNELTETNNYYFDDLSWELYTTEATFDMVDCGMAATKSETGKFMVRETTNYVFRLFKDGYLPSVPVTRSYIKRDKEFTIPVISIVGDDRFFNDPMWGIDVEGTNGISGNGKDYPVNWNQPWDRPVNFSYISPEGEMLFNQDVNTSVSGGWSRMASPRSLKLKSNKIFDGLNHLDYAFFPQKPYIRSKALLVRNGGNDDWCRFKDPAMTTIVQRSGIDLDVQSTVQVAEYINGQFRGILNLREPNNDKFVYANWGYDDEEIDAFENFSFNNGNNEAWNHLLELSERINDNGVYDEVKSLLDIDEFTNYMAVELFLGNSDWPNNNVKGYRSQNDGRFRFVLFDLDQIFNYYCEMSSISTLDTRFADEPLVRLFRNLLGNDEYRKKFIDTFCIMGGSVFEYNRLTAIVNELADAMRPMQQLEGHSPDNSANEINTKMKTRFDEAIDQLREYEPAQIGGLQKQNVQFSANAPGAHILINGIDVPYAEFNGYLFRPVKLEAKAPAGYRFTGWSTATGTASNRLIGTSDTWKYYDKGEASTNWNTNNFNDSGWASGQAPLGYKMTGVKTTVSYGSNSEQKNPTTYFRKSFSLSSTPTNSDKFILNYQVDDGFIVYINGKEAGRINMPSGNVGFNSFSTTYAADTPLTGSLDLSPSLFNSGNNLIAVEIHNNSYTSSDQFWAAELYTTVGTTSDGFVSTEPLLDLPTGSSVALTATFTKLSDEELVAQSISPLRINEVSASNSIYVNEWFKNKDWFEIYNTTDTDLNIAGLYVSDDENNPLKYQIPDNSVLPTIIPAGGHRIVWADEMDAVTQLHTSFKLKNDNDKMVLLSSSDDFVANNATFFNKHPEQKAFTDAIVYTTHQGDQSVGRYPDGGKSFYKMLRPTIEQPNILTSADLYVGEDTFQPDINDNEFTLALAEGWNWMSHPMAESIATSALSEYATRIVGSSSEAIKDTKSGMVGTLSELEPGHLYKVQMQQKDTYTQSGQFCEDGRPIMLLPGWNWIGYTVNGAQALSVALSDFLAEDGDKIIGQSGIATYENGTWQGTLTSFETGMGYMLYTKQAKTLAFKSPSVKVNFSRLHRASFSRASRSRTRSAFIPVSKYTYPNVMGVIAEVWHDGVKAENGRYALMAYDDDGECRGEGQWINGLTWLTLYGKGSESLSYRAIDQYDGTIYNVRETMPFAEGITGSISQPCMLTLGEKTGETMSINGDFATMPTSDIDSYYNLDGTRVTVTARNGVYLVKYKDGSYRKMIVK